MTEAASGIPDEAVIAAWDVLHEVPGWPPYMAHVAEYVTKDSAGAVRQAQMEALRAADAEADALNREVIVRVLAAAAPLIAAADRERWLPLLRAMYKLYDVIWNQIGTVESDVPGYNLLSYDDTNAMSEAGAAVEAVLASGGFAGLLNPSATSEETR